MENEKHPNPWAAGIIARTIPTDPAEGMSKRYRMKRRLGTVCVSALSRTGFDSRGFAGVVIVMASYSPVNLPIGNYMRPHGDGKVLSKSALSPW